MIIVLTIWTFVARPPAFELLEPYPFALPISSAHDTAVGGILFHLRSTIHG